MPPAAMVGKVLGGGAGQEGGREPDWDSKMSWTTQACSEAVSDMRLTMERSTIPHNAVVMMKDN